MKKYFQNLFLFFTFITSLSFDSSFKQKWQPLFDGKTLKGWHILPGGNWKVENGVIVGTSERSDERHGLLVSDKIYKDFELSVQYLAVKGNSGLYFRAEEVGGAYGVKGFQAEIDPFHDAGGLYETSGRDWVVKPDSNEVKKWYKPGEWNTMTVSAKGRSIVVHVNGYKTAELQNDPGRTEGHIALQLHGGQDMLVSFRNIKIKIY
ncbi:DUF1080 domain-containing protein [Pollutibacter soli]|uniref:3-keto-disaccharide hydrolase n=1 Tax=Pollutibacter soli TaxID=3034157 RepID=UPI00301409AC